MKRIMMVLSLLFITSSAMAIHPLKRERTFHIRQFDRTYVICGLRCPENRENLLGGRLAPEMSFEMDPGESVEVWVDDPNPLLFSYKFGGMTQVKNADVVELEKISVGLLKASPALGPIHADEFQNRLEILDFSEPLSSCEDSDVTSKGFGECLQTLIDSLVTDHNQMSGLITDSADPKNWAKIKGITKRWKVDDLAEKLNAAYAKIDKVFPPLKITGAAPSPELKGALDVRDRVSTLLKDLKSFSATVDQIDVPIPITNKDGSPVLIGFDTLNDQRFLVNIASLEEVKGFSKAASGKLTAEKIPPKEDLTIVAIPYHNVHLRTAAAAVYNFVRRPSFDADKKGSDLVIRRKDADRFTGQDVGLMLHVVPANWDEQFLSGEFQFGITPVADKFAAYLGGGVVFKKYFSIATGVVAQRVDRLKSGLHVGDVVATADDVKTVKRFQMGAYICLTVDFKLPTGK